MPGGFERVVAPAHSFAYYLRSLPLKPHGSKVKFYNGSTKNNYGVYDAVVDMDIGTEDLQQCADAIMRLRGEYLFKQNRIMFICGLVHGFSGALACGRAGGAAR